MQVLVSPLRFESLIFGNAMDAKAAVVYLHGKGGFGRGATGQFEWPDMATLLYRREIHPVLPVIIACALDGDRYQIDTLIQYLNELKQTFGLQQIHIIGYSRGGLAAYQLAERGYPLASLTIINANCPTPAGQSQCQGPISRFASPLHIVQGEADDRVDVAAVKAFVAEYEGELIYTQWEGDHYIVADVLADPTLWQWIADKHGPSNISGLT